jgi:uncharacterized protein (TIGR03435 family)
MKITVLRGISIGSLLLTAILGAQTATPKLEFEVASIKPAGPLQPANIVAGKLRIGMTIDGARVDIGMLSLMELIPMAYHVKNYQVSGPDWLGQNRFDILAKMPDGAMKDQVPEMIEALLADRFKLKVHRESREHAVYALVVAKGGPKMKAAVDEPEAPSGVDDAKKGITIGSTDGSKTQVMQDGKGVMMRGGGSGTMRMTPGADGMHLEASAMTMTTLVDTLSRLVDRPVVDMTELKGGYQISLDLSMADMLRAARAAGVGGGVGPGLPGGPGGGISAADVASDPGSSSIFNAVQALGLKLEPRKVPVETIVIDHVEKTPSEN